MRAICHVLLIPVDLIFVIIFGELRHVLKPPLTPPS
jgi:hypothetical protein